MTAGTYTDVGEAAWRWVLDQVRWDDAGPWIPESVPHEGGPPEEDRDGMHSGIGGLAYVLAELRLARALTGPEERLAEQIADRVRAGIPQSTVYTFFDGLVSDIGVLTSLGAPGAQAALDRLAELAGPDGWPQRFVKPPRYTPDARINDLTLGTAGVLLSAVWVDRASVPGAAEVARQAADVLLAEAEPTATGTSWSFVPERFCLNGYPQMPNFSHGLAGIACALALAGRQLRSAELTAAASSGAEHLVSLGESDGRGFDVPRSIPSDAYFDDEFTYGWCHGATGTSLLFLALEHAGVREVAGEAPLTWHRRCLHSVRVSGVPERRYPGFWDNDGRCCGTAGVADAFLDSWQRAGDEQDLEFALRLADALVDRAVVDGPHAYWRFVEHRASDPLLPPGVGWMQGAAGIAAVLFRAARLLEEGRTAAAVARLDNWWAVPAQPTERPPRGPG